VLLYPRRRLSPALHHRPIRTLKMNAQIGYDSTMKTFAGAVER
jgi:hypothetical protein